jgi:hypothetical protein
MVVFMSFASLSCGTHIVDGDGSLISKFSFGMLMATGTDNDGDSGDVLLSLKLSRKMSPYCRSRSLDRFLANMIGANLSCA